MENTPTQTIPRPDNYILKNISKNIAIDLDLIDGVLDVAEQSSIRKYIDEEKVCQNTWKDIYEYLYSLHETIIKDIQEYQDEYQRYGRSNSMQFYDKEHWTLTQYERRYIAKFSTLSKLLYYIKFTRISKDYLYDK